MSYQKGQWWLSTNFVYSHKGCVLNGMTSLVEMLNLNDNTKTLNVNATVPVPTTGTVALTSNVSIHLLCRTNIVPS